VPWNIPGKQYGRENKQADKKKEFYLAHETIHLTGLTDLKLPQNQNNRERILEKHNKFYSIYS
jgi:hypothetical protein